MPEISHFANTVNHPLCQYMQSIPFHKANPNKQKIYFLSGDPTAYGNTQFKMPEAGYEIMKKYIMDTDNHGYTLTTGIPTTRQAILKLYKPKFDVSVAHVCVQHGVNQGLLVALMSFCNQGDEILVPEVGYPIFEKLAPALGIKVLHYNLKKSQNYQLDLPHIKSLLTPKTQFLFLINPSNPMGTIFSLTHMHEILQFCDENELPIIADEVYHGQAFENYQFNSFGNVTENVPVLVLCGVEKVLSVPGWSTSWTVLFDRWGYLGRVWRNVGICGMMFLHTNKFTQLALPQILDKVGLFTQEPIRQSKAIHDKLASQLQSMKGYSPVPAHGTFYMTVILDMTTFSDIKNDLQYVEKLIEQQNIALMPLSAFGGNDNGFRLLTCAKQEVYAEFMSRLEEFNGKHQKSSNE